MEADENLERRTLGYWEDDPEYPSSDWKHQVASNETRLGYWEWVQSTAISNGRP